MTVPYAEVTVDDSGDISDGSVVLRCGNAAAVRDN